MTSPPLSPPEESGPRNGDLPAYVGNGMIGLRVREQPLQPGMAIVNGFAGEHPERRSRPRPWPLSPRGRPGLDGVWLSDQPSAVSTLVQRYDFATAELTSGFRFAAAGVSADVTVTPSPAGRALDRLQEIADPDPADLRPLRPRDCRDRGPARPRGPAAHRHTWRTQARLRRIVTLGSRRRPQHLRHRLKTRVPGRGRPADGPR